MTSSSSSILAFDDAPLQDICFRGFRFTVLRSDLLSPLQGNKAWKLKHNLLRALENGGTRLVTFGGAYSNHLLAVATAAHQFGLRSLGIVRGEEPLENRILARCKGLGMEIRQVTRAAYRDKEACLRSLELPRAGDYVLPEGGTNELAVRGCAEAVPASPQFDHIFLPTATGGTLAGFAAGAASRQPNALVHGNAVLKPAAFLNQVVERFAPRHSNWKIHSNYHHGGFAKSTAELNSFVAEFSISTGIEIEPVYSGKMFYALFDMVAKGAVSGSVLAVHTGGTEKRPEL